MKVLGVDFSYNEGKKLISMYRLNNDKGNVELEYVCSFKEHDNFDLESLIYSQVKNLGINYVVIDKCGITYSLYCGLKHSLGDKVIGHVGNKNIENDILIKLQKSDVFKQIGYNMYEKFDSGGHISLDKKRHTDLELLNIRALGLANYYILKKSLEEREENKFGIEKSNMKCKLKLNCGFGEATLYDITDTYSDDDGNYVIKQGNGEIRIKSDLIDKVVVNKLH